MNFDKIVHTETRQITPDIKVIWYWYDRSDELPGYRYGTDENTPRCGTYQNRKLVSTVYWPPRTDNETIIHFLKTAAPYTKMPIPWSWSPVPTEI